MIPNPPLNVLSAWPSRVCVALSRIGNISIFWESLFSTQISLFAKFFFIICDSTHATNFAFTPMIPDASHGGENEDAVLPTAGSRSPAAALCFVCVCVMWCDVELVAKRKWKVILWLASHVQHILFCCSSRGCRGKTKMFLKNTSVYLHRIFKCVQGHPMPAQL